MSANLLFLVPEICLLAGMVVTLLVGSFAPRDRQWLARLTAAAASAAALVATGLAFTGNPHRYVYDNGFAVDAATDAARLIVAVSLLLIIGLGTERVRGHRREAEFYVLLLAGGLGAVGLAAAADLLVLVVAFLIASVPLYALAGWDHDRLGTEAALKYYLVGSFSGVVMLVGVTLLFAAGRSTSYQVLSRTIAHGPHAVVVVGVVALLAGLLFKAGGVPLHFWVPDVVQGATVPAGAFVVTVPKVGALLAAYRLFAGPLHGAPVDWPLLVGVLAAATITLGNLAAFFQDDARRLLGYSTISQVGYLLLPVAAAGNDALASRGLLFYLLAYAVTNVGVFAVLAELPNARTLSDFSGLVRRHPALAITLAVCLLGFLGTPPTAVFFGKLTVFTAAGGAGLGWLVVVAAAGTVASLFYYLRWLAPAFLGRPEASAALEPAGGWARTTAYAAGAGTLLLGLASGAGFALFTGPLAGH